MYVYTRVFTQPQLDAPRYRDTYPYRPMDLKFISRAAGPKRSGGKWCNHKKNENWFNHKKE